MINRKKINIHPKRLLFTIIVVAILSSIFVYLNVDFSNKLTDSVKKVSYTSVGEIISAVSKGVGASLSSYDRAISNAADSLNHMSNNDERSEYIKNLSLTAGDIIYGFIDSTGNMTLPGKNEQYDVSNEYFFKETLTGETTITTTNISNIGLNSVNNIVIAKPVTKPESDNISNVICGFINPGIIISSFQFEANNIQVLLTNANNGIIAYSNYGYDTNDSATPLYKLVSTPGFIDNFKEISENTPDSVYTLNDKNMTQYIYHTPEVFSDWALYTSILFDPQYTEPYDYKQSIIFLNITYAILLIIILLFYIVPLVHDIGTQRVAESRSMMLANLSHELKTPLNTIIGVSSGLAKSELKNAQLKEVSYITEAANNLLAMINDILDVTKIEAGKFEFVDEEYDFESVIYDLSTVAAVRLGNKPVEFVINIAPYVPRHMIGDMLRVRQLLNNIITNAVKYTEKGVITVTIDCIFIDNADINLVVKVADTGIGMTKKNLEHLFDNFTRFDSIRNKRVEGTGLGMAIAKQFAEMMHGSIEVSSVYGEGSEFTITIAQRIAKNDPLIPAYEPDPSEQYKNILILEQSPALSNFFTGCLENISVNYTIVSDNYEFSKKIAEQRFDYILANSKTISMLSEEMPDADTQLITIIHRTSEYAHDGNTISIPLFSIQINSYLNNMITTNTNNAHQSFLIHTMPDKHILVVDDHQMNIQVALGIMQPYEMKIDYATSGHEAIELVKTNRYDLIFMDHMMPVMDGEKTLNAIRHLKLGYTNDIPVIALTANAAQGAKKMFLELGFQDFLPKPLELRSLHNLLVKWLKPDESKKAVEYHKTYSDEQEHPNSSTSESTKKEYVNEHINVSEGLERIGILPLYIKTLRNFSNTITERMPIIKETFPDDISNFVVEVHGLKGVAAMVSANDFAAFSLKLEQMGKAEDIEGIRALLPDYYDAMLKIKAAADDAIDHLS